MGETIFAYLFVGIGMAVMGAVLITSIVDAVIETKNGSGAFVPSFIVISVLLIWALAVT
jgi:hypothetical protein